MIKKIFLCPWCGESFSLNMTDSIEERESPKWWQTSHKNISRCCPYCSNKIRIKPRSIASLWLIVPLLGTALWGALSNSLVEWIGWVGIAMVILYAYRALKIEKADT